MISRPAVSCALLLLVSTPFARADFVGLSHEIVNANYDINGRNTGTIFRTGPLS